MNNLKVRVYNKRLKKMLQPSEILSINLLDKKVITVNWEEFSYSEDEYNSESALMLAIGKVDRYWKDIFDGDLVEYIDYYDDNWSVLGKKQRWIVLYDEEESWYAITHRSIVEMYNIGWNNITVLGNIYEDNELFEEISMKDYYENIAF